jgi:DNA-3-methyladenine glycosylase II
MKVTPPFRLDLTVTVLRRLPTNVVDVLTPEGEYLRALGDEQPGAGWRPSLVRVRQARPDMLAIELEGGGSAEERRGLLALLRRTLGVDRDLGPF